MQAFTFARCNSRAKARWQVPFEGDRTAESIVAWLKKKTGPSLVDLSTAEQASGCMLHAAQLLSPYLPVHCMLTVVQADAFAAGRLVYAVGFFQKVRSRPSQRCRFCHAL